MSRRVFFIIIGSEEKEKIYFLFFPSEPIVSHYNAIQFNMPKIINLKPDEEITSAVEYLWETGANEVYFVIPDGSVLLKNIIGLKLLKREADRLDKTVVLVTKNEIGREMIKRGGLTVRVTMPKLTEETELFKKETEGAEEEVLKELPSKKYESMIEEEVKLKRETAGQSQRISDIRFRPPLGKAKATEAEEVKEEEMSEEKPAEDKTEEKEEIKKFSSEKILSESQDKLDSYLISAEETAKESVRDEDEEKFRPFRGFMAKKLARVKTEKSSFLFSFKFLSFFVAAAFLIAAAVLYFVLPKAEIVVVPKTEVVVQDLALTADKSATKIDAVQARIPAQLIKLDKKASKEFAATGQRQFNDKARGIITVYNEFSSSPQGLVEKTRFISDSGKVFRLTKAITVPGAKIEEGKIIRSSIDAEVVADQPGEEYNIGPSNFKIPGFQGSSKYDAFYGRSQKPMTGGAIGLAKVVSQDDFDKAKAELWQGLRSSIEQELKNQVPSGLKILDGAIKEEITSTESNVVVGSRVDNFTITITGAGMVLLFDENDIYGLAMEKNEESLNNNKTLDEKGKLIEYSDTRSDFNKGQLVFKAKVSERLLWKIDINELKRLIVGKDEPQIKQAFEERSEIDKARILFWPFWVKSVPDNIDKIKIRISVD